MKEYVIQYIDESDKLQVAYIRAYSREEAADKLRNKLRKENNHDR